MNDSYPSVCPECNAVLDHKTKLPGGADATVTVTCPDCEYEESFGDDTDQ